MKKFLLIFLGLLFITGSLFANVLQVPQQFGSIQEAITTAADGDVVLVAEGTYYENINFMGKKITVTSLFYQDQKKIHIKRTIINGSKPANPDFGSVVSFVSGEDITSVLCGFTITGGTGMLSAAPGFPPMRLGGGILCWGSGAKIVHNIIIGNTLSGTPWAMGGGVCISPPFMPIYAIIENNVIEKNMITGFSRVSGGGVDFSASGKVINNIINNNTAIATVEAPAGGGLALQSWQPPVPNNEVLVSGNTINYNKALQPDNATYWLGGIGAGLWLIGSKGVIEKNIIQHNEVSGALSTYGSGVLLDYPPDDLTLKNNMISENYFSGSGICNGGGLGIWDGNPLLTNNVFAKNQGSVGGGVWLGYDFCFAKLTNNTFTENQATIQGGALNTFNSHPVLMNSILWGNKAPVDAEICLESGEIDVSYCDIAGGWTGEGNLDSDPLLMSEFRLLSAHSPCVDRGNAAEIFNDTESPFRPGYAMLPARGMLRNDVGAYGGPAAADWKLDQTYFKAKSVLAKNKNVWSKSFPNPFNAETTIEFLLDQSARVNLDIYNVIGQKIVTLAEGPFSEGTYKYTWNANAMASGVYFYKLEINGQVMQMQKLILLK